MHVCVCGRVWPCTRGHVFIEARMLEHACVHTHVDGYVHMHAQARVCARADACVCTGANLERGGLERQEAG